MEPFLSFDFVSTFSQVGMQLAVKLDDVHLHDHGEQHECVCYTHQGDVVISHLLNVLDVDFCFPYSLRHKIHHPQLQSKVSQRRGGRHARGATSIQAASEKPHHGIPWMMVSLKNGTHYGVRSIHRFIVKETLLSADDTYKKKALQCMWSQMHHQGEICTWGTPYKYTGNQAPHTHSTEGVCTHMSLP